MVSARSYSSLIILNPSNNVDSIEVITRRYFPDWHALVYCLQDQDHAAKPEAEKPAAKAPDTAQISPAPEAGKGGMGILLPSGIGNDLKISGAVSMDDNGVIVAPGNMEQQMKNCYSDLEKILKHYGYSYDDVVVENISTTNMQEFLKVSGFRNTIYTKQFPTGTWLEVKGLAVQGQLIEIDMEAHKAE